MRRWALGGSVVEWELLKRVPGVSCYLLGVDRMLVVVECGSEWSECEGESGVGWNRKSLFDWRFVVVDQYLVVVVTRPVHYRIGNHCLRVVVFGSKTLLFFEYEYVDLFAKSVKTVQKSN